MSAEIGCVMFSYSAIDVNIVIIVFKVFKVFKVIKVNNVLNDDNVSDIVSTKGAPKCSVIMKFICIFKK